MEKIVGIEHLPITKVIRHNDETVIIVQTRISPDVFCREIGPSEVVPSQIQIKSPQNKIEKLSESELEDIKKFELMKELKDIWEILHGKFTDWEEETKMLCLHIRIRTLNGSTEVLVDLHGPVLDTLADVTNGKAKVNIFDILFRGRSLIKAGPLEWKFTKRSDGILMSCFSTRGYFTTSYISENPKDEELQKFIEDWVKDDVQNETIKIQMLSVKHELQFKKQENNPSDLSNFMMTLLDDARDVDVLLKSPEGDWNIPCHKTFLIVNSTMMKRKFEGTVGPNSPNEIKFCSEDKHVARALLAYIYGRDVFVPTKFMPIAIELLRLGGFYGIPHLVKDMWKILKTRSDEFFCENEAELLVECVTSEDLVGDVAEKTAKIMMWINANKVGENEEQK